MEERNINFTVKFTTQSIPITISHDSTVQRLKTILRPVTSIFPSDQKLIFKGRILENDKSLRESGINNGAKIMLVGTMAFYLGDGPMMGEAPSRIVTTEDFKPDKSHIKWWKVTNTVPLAACNLKDIPDEVWTCAPYIRILDISYNLIQHVPDRIDCLAEMRELSLNGNRLSDESISWRGLKNLKLLQVLSLSQNCLNTLPSTLGLLTSLQQLHVANNNLTALPIEIGNLTKLKVLEVDNNGINSIPSSIGNCTSLIKVDLSSNHLSELPNEFCSLQNLKALHISNNAMKSLPNSLFRMCTQLSTLDLRNTEITMDTLLQALRFSNNAVKSLPNSLFRVCAQLSTLDLHYTEITIDSPCQCEGWEDFDERHRAKNEKQIDFHLEQKEHNI